MQGLVGMTVALAASAVVTVTKMGGTRCECRGHSYKNEVALAALPTFPTLPTLPGAALAASAVPMTAGWGGVAGGARYECHLVTAMLEIPRIRTTPPSATSSHHLLAPPGPPGPPGPPRTPTSVHIFFRFSKNVFWPLHDINR